MIQNPGKKQEHFERYEEHKQKLKEFISTFQDVRLEVPEDSPYRSFGKRKYMIELVRRVPFRTGSLTSRPRSSRSFWKTSRNSSGRRTRRPW